ncbi:MAG: DUF805 domain-containing protein [Pseudomonadota bacterium]
MNWFKNLFSFGGTAKRSELLRKLAGCAFLVWLGAVLDEQIIVPYLCSNDPLKIGCIPGEVTEGFSIENNIVFLIMLALVLIPVIAVMVRRLQDHDKSGWWLLVAFTGIGLLPLIYWFMKRAPKAISDANA